jgi:GDP-4-dehydro-6-deoxy-D-mannose reductase
MNILLTGASGFVGCYVKLALSQFHTCVPLADANGTIDLRDIERIKLFLSSNIKPYVKLNKGSKNNAYDTTLAQPHTCGFDAIIHLAAQSFVPESFKNPLETFDVNFTGTYNLFRALKAYGFYGKILYISSGDIYGLVSEDKLPITEDELLKPRSPYAVSKVAAEALCYQWSITEDMEIIIARPFNHIGPNQSERFAVPSFGKQIAEIELGLRKPVISTGNIDITRDFLDVRDVAEAYKLLLEKAMNFKEQGTEINIKTESNLKASTNTNTFTDTKSLEKNTNTFNDANELTKKDAKEIKNVENFRSYVYNVCSGSETSIRSIINMMLKITGVNAKIETDNNKLRPNEQKRVYGNNEKIKKITGWEPKIPLEQSLKDILNYWKEKLKN